MSQVITDRRISAGTEAKAVAASTLPGASAAAIRSRSASYSLSDCRSMRRSAV